MLITISRPSSHPPLLSLLISLTCTSQSSLCPGPKWAAGSHRFSLQLPEGACEHPSQVCSSSAQNPPLHVDKNQTLPAAHKALHDLPGPLPFLCSSLSPPSSLQSCHTSLPSVLPTCRALSSLRGAVPSVWKALPLGSVWFSPSPPSSLSEPTLSVCLP